MIVLTAQGELWPDAMVARFVPVPGGVDPVGLDLVDPDRPELDEDFYCGDCRHMHDQGAPCLSNDPCGDYRCCIN